jgi:acyl dehydratase
MSPTELRKPLWSDTFRLDLKYLVRYAGASGDLNPIHYDQAFATSAGLPGIIVHGMLSLGIIARLVRQNTPGPLCITHLSARFHDVLVPDQDIEVACSSAEPHECAADPAGARTLRLEMRHAAAGPAAVTCKVVIVPVGEGWPLRQ